MLTRTPNCVEPVEVLLDFLKRHSQRQGRFGRFGPLQKSFRVLQKQLGDFVSHAAPLQGSQSQPTSRRWPTARGRSSTTLFAQFAEGSRRSSQAVKNVNVVWQCVGLANLPTCRRTCWQPIVMQVVEIPAADAGRRGGRRPDHFNLLDLLLGGAEVRLLLRCHLLQSSFQLSLRLNEGVVLIE